MVEQKTSRRLQQSPQRCRKAIGREGLEQLRQGIGGIPTRVCFNVAEKALDGQ
jgi:hypothetical protein